MRCLITQFRRFNYYDDMVKACRENGLEVACVYCDDLEDGGQVLETVNRFRPHFILNHPIYSLVASRVGAMKGIPVVHWIVDKILNKECYNSPIYSDTDLVLSTYREDADKLAALGVRAGYLLNACNIEPVDYGRVEKQYGVTFVGTIELGKNNYYRQIMASGRDTFDRASPAHAALFQTIQNACDEILHQQQEASRLFLYKVPELVAEMYKKTGHVFLQARFIPDDVVALLTKETAFHQRRHFLQAIPQLDAFGPEDWTQAELPNVSYRGAVDLRASGHVFAASRINLSITRIYQLDGLSDRIFNVLRARGFLLANRQETLSEVFQEGVHLDTYSTVEELLDKIRFYEKSPHIREKIAARGYDNVLKNHTFTQRIREMLPLLSL
ncbi:MAG: glycosyltransferase family 1 protein [Magnetococcales bacterium]|nr:glycosyltransferase family 1 protein [Magnetococcales bacterium]